ncbi:MAG: hypothetical protein WDO73_29375 [Ignavibacteriota bacterium]
MKTVPISTPLDIAAVQDLRASMRGKVVVAGEEAYQQVRQIWNGAIDHQPAVIALCETVEDVQIAIRTARGTQPSAIRSRRRT